MMWWLDYLNSYRWSEDERRAFRRIWWIALLLLLVIFCATYGICKAIGVNEFVATMLAMMLGLGGGFYLARRLCLLFWPTLMAVADAKALARLN